MKIEFKDNEGQVTLALNGKLDTATAMKATTDINSALAKVAIVKSLTIDANRLDYISSSGLRILLTLVKKYPNLRLTNVQKEVYEVLDMTGFNRIIKTEKILRHISVEGCEVIGRGGVGTVYRLDDDTIIKVFRQGTTMDEVKQEIGMAKEAFVLGMPTAISFDVVMVPSPTGQCDEAYGLVYELLRADTLSAVVKRDPERLDYYARKYADLLRSLHSIDVPQDGIIPNAIEHERQSVMSLTRYFTQDEVDVMLQIIDAIPPANRLLHLDLQTKNAMMQGDELMLIDMGEVGYGHPLLDLGHAYSAMVKLVGNYEQIIGMPRELGTEMWNRAINYYFKGLSDEETAHRKKQIETVSCVRNFSWLSLSDSFPKEVIDQCKALMAERITNRKEELLAISRTFCDWTL